MVETIEILGVKFANLNREQVLSTIYTGISENKKQFIVTANPEIVMYANSDNHYKQVLEQADMIVADGIGVVIGSRLLKTPLPERVAGYDLMIELLKEANQNKWRVFFLGAKEQVLEKALSNIKKDYPNLIIAGSHHGYFEQSDQSISELVQSSNPDIVLAALGFPRQENWIQENLYLFNKGVFMGVGGSFDVVAGEVQRAPLLWQKLNLEWFYRLIKQPSRWRRMLVLPQFLIEVLKVKSHIKSNGREI